MHELPAWLPIVLSLLAGAWALGIGVVGFFLKRLVSGTDKKFEKLEAEQTAQRIRDEDKREVVRKEYEGKLESFQSGIGQRLDRISGDATRAVLDSSHDLQARDSTRIKVENLQRELLEYKTKVASEFVSKESFIRESTLLDSRITTTNRTLDGIDILLRQYLKE